jgi:hypothetical protein
VCEDFSLLKPGLIFFTRTGGGNGHMGWVEDFRDDRLITIEGNTNLQETARGLAYSDELDEKFQKLTKGLLVTIRSILMEDSHPRPYHSQCAIQEKVLGSRCIQIMRFAALIGGCCEYSA